VRVGAHSQQSVGKRTGTPVQTQTDWWCAVFGNVSAAYPTVWVVTRSDPDPIVVNLPELDKFAERAARKYPHP
jgi:hypothetical protein